MQDKEKATPAKVVALKKTRDQFSGTSSATQRDRLEAALREWGTVTTFEAREYLDIYHPAGRVKEMRDEGLGIITVWVTVESENGELHRVAKYVLNREVAHA